ncbi:CDP-glycerol glycerophosphotransferase family protein [Paraclostridium bifermentans]|uniref:CDP-glycerol glycerophosphotransferase family protein n=1 Tax=Paraclostridium bifermentans TaxID=1490 RepID=UPI00189A109E|nr:CDP-glycerol glycerophosphotransferase family protein [Paraclostridium bifermentans]
MRLNKKNDILQLIDTVSEAFVYIESNYGEEMQTMILECLEALKYIRAKLDKENDKTLKIINGLITHLNETLNLLNEDEKGKKNIALIKSKVLDLKYSIKNDIDNQIEIAFLPYKVSMWDCMESVWKEAKEDPNCSCYVIPIPYYEFNKNGEVEKICYEGSEFSNEIDITPFNLYDLESRKPDIIYIHNPYDDCNLLTMLPQKYFSENLSKYTNMLVYIPYFVAGSYKNLEAHKSVSLMPGPINANKIIAQSETQRELFISNGHNYEKVIDLGSPKFDSAILNLNKNHDNQVGWENIINDKKVFLFSTGITNLLSDENWINDLNDVIDSFKNHNKCSLIWRLHPLTEVTINRMRPNLLDDFKKIKSKIADAENIIIDSSSDIYTSMRVSDALISDYSSIVFQYMVTGKPILGIFENELLKKDRIYTIDYLGNYFKNRDMGINDFRNMVLSGNDIKKEERMDRLNNSIKNIDGTCGKKVHEYIKCQVLSSISN